MSYGSGNVREEAGETNLYAGYLAVIVRLDAIDEERLAEIVEMAWDAAPLSSKG